MGCMPPAISMMLRRRIPMAAPAETKAPSSSGPRRTIASSIRPNTAALSSLGSSPTTPQIPHIFFSPPIQEGPKACCRCNRFYRRSYSFRDEAHGVDAGRILVVSVMQGFDVVPLHLFREAAPVQFGGHGATTLLHSSI